MEVEPRIAKQYKCHQCCICKKLPGKVDGGWKKVSLRRFLADQKIASSWGEKMRFGASYSQAHSDYGPPKMSLKLAVSNS